MAKECPCVTHEGHSCTRPVNREYDFCGTHLNQLVSAMDGNTFQRSRVMRTSFRTVDPTIIDTNLSRWSDSGENEDVRLRTEPSSNLPILLEILEVRGETPIKSLTLAYNSRLKVQYPACTVGKALTPLVLAGVVSKRLTRERILTNHKTTVYRLVD